MPQFPPLHLLSLEPIDAPKRKRVDIPLDLPPNPVMSLNTIGGFAVRVPTNVDLDRWKQALEVGTARWFWSMVDVARSAPIARPGAGFDVNTLVAQKVIFDAIPPTVQRELIGHFDPSTANGRRNLESSQRKQQATRLAAPFGCADYLRYIVTIAKQGGVSMALAAMHQSWTDPGFGLWAHLVTDDGLTLTMQMADALRDRMGLDASLHGHFSHLIRKAEVSGALATHHDQRAPRALQRELRTFLDTEADPTTLNWVRRHGLQMLLHLEGGNWHPVHDRSEESAATYVIGPMTPRRLLFVLDELDRDPRRYGVPAGFWERTEGPYFLKYETILNDLNDRLVAQRLDGLPGLQRVPLQTAADGANDGDPMLVGWPVGWLHGSYQSSSHQRLTLTVPIDVRAGGRHDEAHRRNALDAIEWMEDLATLALHHFPTEESEGALVDAYRRVRGRTKPFADGPTHRRPYTATQLFLGPAAREVLVRRGVVDASEAKVGWFHELAPRHTTVHRYSTRFGMPRGQVATTTAASSSSGGSRRLDSSQGASSQAADAPTSPHDSDDSDSDDSDSEVLFASSSDESSSDDDDGGAPSASKASKARARGGGKQKRPKVDLPTTYDPTPASALERRLASRFPHLQPWQADVVRALATDDELRCLNVRQPWALLLTLGYKTVENRPMGANRPRVGTDGDDLSGEWVLIVASKGVPTGRVTTQAKDEYLSSAADGERDTSTWTALVDMFDDDRHSAPRGVQSWPRGAIVGAVRFTRLLMPQATLGASDETLGLRTGTMSWYHEGDVGWYASAAIPFYVPRVPGVLSIAKLSTKGPAIDHGVRERMRALASPQ